MSWYSGLESFVRRDEPLAERTTFGIGGRGGVLHRAGDGGGIRRRLSRRRCAPAAGVHPRRRKQPARLRPGRAGRRDLHDEAGGQSLPAQSHSSFSAHAAGSLCRCARGRAWRRPSSGPRAPGSGARVPRRDSRHRRRRRPHERRRALRHDLRRWSTRSGAWTRTAASTCATPRHPMGISRDRPGRPDRPRRVRPQAQAAEAVRTSAHENPLREARLAAGAASTARAVSSRTRARTRPVN